MTEFSDPLALQLLDEHRRWYERIKAWREAQSDPYFTDVSPQWRREFERWRQPKPPQRADNAYPDRRACFGGRLRVH